MGLQTQVTFSGPPPFWVVVRDHLASCGDTFHVCMIDGELSFPDEEPPESWKELRLRTSSGMITVRRESNRLVFITWGNANPQLLKDRTLLVQTFAELGGGTVEIEEP